MVLRVLDRAHRVAVVAQELYLVAGAVGHRRQFTETRVLAVQEGVACLARCQVLRCHVLAVSEMNDGILFSLGLSFKRFMSDFYLKQVYSGINILILCLDFETML